MMISLKRYIGLLSLLALCPVVAACTTATTSQQKAPAAAAPRPAGGIEGRIGTLPPQDLPEGSCGMFLWARTSERNMIFHALDRTLSARMIINGAEISLPRTVADGEMVFGHYTTQEFARDNLRVRVVVSPEPNSGIIGGAVVRRGMLNFSDGAGPDLVLPVAGLIACKAPPR